MAEEAKVVKQIDPQTVVINRGRSDGIKNGDRYLVYSLGEELADPDTGENLGRLEVVKGKGKVVHLQDHVAHIETYEYEPEYTQIQRQGPFGFIGPSTETKKQKKEFVDVTPGDFVRKL